MKLRRRLGFLLAVFVAFVLFSSVAAATDVPLKNWSAPAFWSASAASGGMMALADISGPLPFIPITPCRVVDTRSGFGFTGQYGPPAIVAQAAARSFTITGQCGIPAGASAVSFEFTVVNQTSAGNFRAFPQGSPMPTASVLNWIASSGAIGNGIVVPLGTGGSAGGLSVYLNAPLSNTADLVLDVNGYYASTPATATNYFSVINSGLYAIYGETSNTDPFAAGVYGKITAGPAQGVFGQSVSTADGTAGVFGYASASTGSNQGVGGWTNSASNGATGVFGLARAATGQTVGVWGQTKSTSDNANGVLGRAVATTGQTQGVRGNNFSSTDFAAGVLGDARSTTGQVIGVLGISESLASGIGVAGALVDTAGNPTVYGVLGAAIGTAADTTGPPWGVFAFGNLGATGSKHFVEPHPSDPAKVIVYSSLEGREVGTYFRGTAQVVNHQAVIEVPEDFRMVTDGEGLTVQLTPVGELATLAVVSQDLNQILVKASKDVTFHYLVQGVRRAFRDLQPVRIGYEFVPRSPNDPMQPFLTEEARRRLIANGTYNADGTVNMETAERLGWAKAWRENGANTRAAHLARPLSDPETVDEKK